MKIINKKFAENRRTFIKNTGKIGAYSSALAGVLLGKKTSALPSHTVQEFHESITAAWSPDHARIQCRKQGGDHNDCDFFSVDHGEMIFDAAGHISKEISSDDFYDFVKKSGTDSLSHIVVIARTSEDSLRGAILIPNFFKKCLEVFCELPTSLFQEGMGYFGTLAPLSSQYETTLAFLNDQDDLALFSYCKQSDQWFENIFLSLKSMGSVDQLSLIPKNLGCFQSDAFLICRFGKGHFYYDFYSPNQDHLYQMRLVHSLENGHQLFRGDEVIPFQYRLPPVNHKLEFEEKRTALAELFSQNWIFRDVISYDFSSNQQGILYSCGKDFYCIDFIDGYPQIISSRSAEDFFSLDDPAIFFRGLMWNHRGQNKAILMGVDKASLTVMDFSEENSLFSFECCSLTKSLLPQLVSQKKNISQFFRVLTNAEQNSLCQQGEQNLKGFVFQVNFKIEETQVQCLEIACVISEDRKKNFAVCLIQKSQEKSLPQLQMNPQNNKIQGKGFSQTTYLHLEQLTQKLDAYRAQPWHRNSEWEQLNHGDLIKEHIDWYRRFWRNNSRQDAVRRVWDIQIQKFHEGQREYLFRTQEGQFFLPMYEKDPDEILLSAMRKLFDGSRYPGGQSHRGPWSNCPPTTYDEMLRCYRGLVQKPNLDRMEEMLLRSVTSELLACDMAMEILGYENIRSLLPAQEVAQIQHWAVACL